MSDASASSLARDLLAVSPAGLTTTALARALHQAGVRVGRKPVDNAAILRVLAAAPDVTHERRWGIEPAAGEARYRRMAADGTLREVEDLAFAVEPWQREDRWGYGHTLDPNANERMVRRALRDANDDVLTACLDAGASLDVCRWFADPFPSDAFAAYSPQGAQRTGAAWMLEVDVDGAPLSAEAEAAFLARGGELAAEVALRRGRLDEAADHLKGSDRIGFHHGLLALLRGDVKAAVKHYASAMAALRKARGTDVLPHGFAGHFLPLAYLLSGTKSRRKQALSLIHRAQRTLRWGRPTVGWQNLRTLDDPQEPLITVEHPFAVVTASLVARWRGEPLSADTLHKARTTLDRMGHDLLVQELGPTSRLLPLRETRAVWEDLLTRLEEASGAPRSAATEDTADRRLVWTLVAYGGTPHLEGREQVRRAKGWSGGRKVADARLYMTTDLDLPWTEEDKRLVRGLARRSQRDWRGYTHATFSWSTRETWVGLIGHPRIVDADGAPVQVVARPPALVVEEHEGGVRVRLEPEVGEHDVHVTPIGNGYEITYLTDAQHEAATLMLGGITFPAEARERLGPVIERLGERFVPPTTVTTREAPTDVGAWVRPTGNTLVVELGVLPLGPDGSRHVPGRGEPVLLASEGGRGVRVARDLVAERAEARAVLALIDEEAELPDHAFPSLEAGLTFLGRARAAGVSLYWPEGGELVVRRPQAIDIRVSVRKEWFEAGGSLDLGERVLQLAELLEGKLGHGRFVQLDDGSYLELETKLHRRLDALARLSDGTGRVHALAAPAVADLTDDDDVQATPAAQRLLERFDAPFDAPPVPQALRAELRPYQVDAYRWLCGLAHLGVGGILADDMGLGKTVTTLAFLLQRRADGPALVVAPTSVAGNWMKETARFAPDLTLHRLGTAALPETLGPGDLVIASYGLLVARTAVLQQTDWHTIVFDESQALKNADTQRHQAAASLQAPVRLCLTGTPIENQLSELHSQLSLVAPGLLPERRAFQNRIALPIERDDRDARRLLQRLVAPFLLRRTKDAVLDDLPPRIDNELLVELLPDERAVYEAQRRAAVEAVDEGRGAIEVLAHLTKLRRAACSAALLTDRFHGESAKTRAFRRLAGDLVANGHRALVFSQFLDHLALLRAVLNDLGFDHIYLDGRTPSAQRDRLVQQFQTTDVPFFLISLKAGGTGVNLTAADYVLHMDPWWNPAVEDQASDRAHRMGQTRPVTVYRIVAKDTVEEQILELHRSKRDLADQILEGQERVVKLGVEELRGLLDA